MVFFHVDMDAFYASVEQLDFPEYRGKPVIVGGLPEDRRSVVSTCSYEARAFGVHSAMPVVKAYSLCPHGIFLHGRMGRYREKSREIMNVLCDFSPDVQQISIDEAFIDMTGTERLFGPAESTARRLKQQVKNKTGLTISVGIASTKYLAKIASGMSKPDGLHYVPSGKETEFMQELPLHKVWGIGEKTLARLNESGIYTTKDVFSRSEALLSSLFGSSTGAFLYRAVRGLETETFNETAKSRSISSEETFLFDLEDPYAIDTELLQLSEEVLFRLLAEGWTSKTVHVKIRYEDFTTVSIQETLPRHIATAEDIYERAKQLFYRKWQTGRGVRLLGVGALNLEPALTPRQTELFDFGDGKKQRIEKAVLNIRRKNPESVITKARLLQKAQEREKRRISENGTDKDRN